VLCASWSSADGCDTVVLTSVCEACQLCRTRRRSIMILSSAVGIYVWSVPLLCEHSLASATSELLQQRLFRTTCTQRLQEKNRL
jgi:hypothetical protein